MKAAVRLVLIAFVCLCASLRMAFAIETQIVTSPGGITAWLVESHAIPMISMDFAFDGGTALDPPGKEGAVTLMTALMDEGAADMDSAAFQAKVIDLNMYQSFRADTENMVGSLTLLSKNREQSFALLKKALTAPRFDADPVERMRSAQLQSVMQSMAEQNTIAARAWFATAFPGHAYTRPTDGTPESLAAITVDDIKALHKVLFSRRGMKIAVVGDIDAATLAPLLDDVFGALPDTPLPHPVTKATPVAGPQQQVIPFDSPQTAIVFGGPGVALDDPAYYATALMFDILGGEANFARLSTEVREKRGLTYGISMGNSGTREAPYSTGFFTTANATAGEALKVVKDELQRMAATGPTADELDRAKKFSNGSYPLRFSSNSAISSALLGLQLNGLRPTHPDTRAGEINAVTLAQVQEQARRLLAPGNLIVTLVGKPEGL